MLEKVTEDWKIVSKGTFLILIFSCSLVYNMIPSLSSHNTNKLAIRVANLVQQIGFSLSAFIFGVWIMHIGQDGLGVLNGLFCIFLVNQTFAFFRFLMQKEENKDFLENIHHVFTFSIVKYFIRNYTQGTSQSVLILSLVSLIILVFYVNQKIFIGTVYKESSTFFVQQLIYRKTSELVVSLFKNVNSITFVLMSVCSILLIDVIYKLGVKKVDVYLTWMIVEQLLNFLSEIALPPIITFLFLVLLFYISAPRHGFVSSSDQYLVNTIKLALSKSYADLIHHEVKYYDFFMMFLVYIVAISVFLNMNRTVSSI